MDAERSIRRLASWNRVKVEMGQKEVIVEKV